MKTQRVFIQSALSQKAMLRLSIGMLVFWLLFMLCLMGLFRFLVAETAVVRDLAALSLAPAPGTSQSPDSQLADEITLVVDAQGQVSLDDDQTFRASVESKDAPWRALTVALIHLREQAARDARRILVTLQVDSQTPYHFVTELMDAVSAAQIKGVTFTVASEEK